MKNVLFLVTCPLAAVAASLPRAVPSGPFSLGAWKPATGCKSEAYFLGTSVNASGGKFYINKPTSTYCPDGVQNLDCSLFSGNGTILAMSEGSSGIGMSVTVPGGQQGTFTYM
jgi:hypothetical protein